MEGRDGIEDTTTSGTPETSTTTKKDTGTATASDTGTPTDTVTGTPPEETDTPTPEPDSLEASLQDGQPDPLPAIWTSDNSVSDHSPFIQVETEQSLPVTLNAEHWDQPIELGNVNGTKNQVIEPRQLRAGENTVTAETENASAEVQIQKKVPKLKKLDITPANNDQLRRQVSDQYLQENQVSNDNPIYTNYTTPETLSYNKYPVDLTALEHWHDNDYENIQPEEGQQFVQSIGPKEEATGMALEAMTEPEAIIYPNQEESEYQYGHFVYNDPENETGLRQANSAGQALEWLHAYLFNWQIEYNNRTGDTGPISTEDELYAGVIQEALDTHTEIESHIWAFDLPEHPRSTHGNGLIWDEEQEELRIFETITSPETQELSENDPQLHPLIEDSNYLNPDNEAWNEWWHPLRFSQEYQEGQIAPGYSDIDFEAGKDYASRLLIGISTGWKDEDRDTGKWWTEAGLGLSSEYVSDRIQKLKNYNSNDLDFNQLKQESKILNYFWEEHDGNAIVYLDEDDSLSVAEGMSDDVIEDVWKDEEGVYDDFDGYIESQVESGNVSFETADSMLEGSATMAGA